MPREGEPTPRRGTDLTALVRAIHSTRPTPTNFGSELERLVAVWSDGGEAAPSFSYAPSALPISRLREVLAHARGVRPDTVSIAALYSARLDELSLELELADPQRAPSERTAIAARRFGDPAGDALADEWLARGHEPQPSDELILTDDNRDPRSLVRALKEEIGRTRAACRVVILSDLASLAAYKDGVVFVAKGKRISARQALRIMRHEVHGHLLPSLEAQRQTEPIFGYGSARGFDDQEGYAVLLEDRGGHLDRERAFELAARHHAARSVHDGASFVDIVRALLARGAPLRLALRASMRAHRGGKDGDGGLGRERVYLSGYERVRRALSIDPGLERVVASGAISVEAAAVLKDRR
jgi:hypothetical protein